MLLAAVATNWREFIVGCNNFAHTSYSPGHMDRMSVTWSQLVDFSKSITWVTTLMSCQIGPNWVWMPLGMASQKRRNMHGPSLTWLSLLSWTLVHAWLQRVIVTYVIRCANTPGKNRDLIRQEITSSFCQFSGIRAFMKMSSKKVGKIGHLYSLLKSATEISHNHQPPFHLSPGENFQSVSNLVARQVVCIYTPIAKRHLYISPAHC